MVKYALLVGINYLLTPSMRLYSAYNDVILLNDFLIKFAGYSTENILILSDICDVIEKDTIQSEEYLNSFLNKNTLSESTIAVPDNISYNAIKKQLYGTLEDHPMNLSASFFSIVKTMKELLSLLKEDDSLFIYFNGHGSQLRDENGDEVDNMDEVFFPSDFSRHSITDDLLRSLIKKSETKGTIYFVFDCCNSGSMIDLRFRYDIHRNTLTENLRNMDDSKTIKNNKIVSLSSCNDDETSYETLFEYKGKKVIHSAFTYRFVELLKKSITDLITPTVFDIYKELKTNAITSNSILELEGKEVIDATYLTEFVYKKKEIKNANNNDIDEPVERELVYNNIREVLNSNDMVRIKANYKEVSHNNKKLKKKIEKLNERLSTYDKLYGNSSSFVNNFNNLRFSSFLKK